METNITYTNSYGYTPENNLQKQNLKSKQAELKPEETKKQNKPDDSSDSADTSYIKILIAQLAAAKTSAEASDYIVKLNIELSKLQSSNKNAILINKIKKVIQNGNKKVSQLKEEEIPLAAQIVSIVDVFCALTEKRSYRKEYSKEEALQIMSQESGKKFHPEIFKIFHKIARQLC